MRPLPVPTWARLLSSVQKESPRLGTYRPRGYTYISIMSRFRAKARIGIMRARSFLAPTFRARTTLPELPRHFPNASELVSVSRESANRCHTVFAQLRRRHATVLYALLQVHAPASRRPGACPLHFPNASELVSVSRESANRCRTVFAPLRRRHTTVLYAPLQVRAPSSRRTGACLSSRPPSLFTPSHSVRPSGTSPMLSSRNPTNRWNVR